MCWKEEEAEGGGEEGYRTSSLSLRKRFMEEDEEKHLGEVGGGGDGKRPFGQRP